MSDFLVVIGLVVGLLVGYGVGRVMTTASFLDRLAEQPGQVGDPHALDQTIVARVSGLPPRPRPVPPTEVLTRPTGVGRLSNDDARHLFPATCGPDGKCARHSPAICLRGDRCCSRCPA